MEEKPTIEEVPEGQSGFDSVMGHFEKFSRVADRIESYMTEENVAIASANLERCEKLFSHLRAFAEKNEEAIRISYDVVVLLYGPLFYNTILVASAFRQVGWDTVKENAEGLKLEYCKVREARSRRGGRIDAFVFMEAVNPEKVAKLVKGAMLGFTAALATLQSPPIQVLASGVNLGEQVCSSARLVVDPLVMDRIKRAEEAEKLPRGALNWAEVFLRYFWIALGIYVASVVRKPLITVAAVAKAAQSLTECLTTRSLVVRDSGVPPTVIQYGLTAIGLYHIFILGGSDNLPSIAKAVVWLPLQVESFVSWIPNSVQFFHLKE
ncbi:hypothetical protein DIPPA_32618 [Diplonema papillatum]|nr:hypothetical protein DIPPA_32618 [Diplonema papillatum]